MSYEKIRMFKPGEFLNTCFSAREFGLCLVTDVTHAAEEFPDRRNAWSAEDYCDKVDAWYEKWLSTFRLVTKRRGEEENA